MREPRSALICGLLLLLSLSSRAQSTAHERLVDLAHDITFTPATLYPMQATALGIAGHDAEFEEPSEAFAPHSSTI